MDASCVCDFAEEMLEAPTGIEPVMRALQAPALPLGYGAPRSLKYGCFLAFRQPAWVVVVV